MRPSKTLWFRLPSAFVRRHADAAAVLVLLALTVVAEGGLFSSGLTLGSDAATQYYPFYYLVGESLSSAELPGWNPYQFSGTPLAADPLTGWAYLPAMGLFTFLPLVAAIKGFMLFHLLLAGLFTYALARTLGIAIPGAFLSAIAYEYSGLLYVQNTCCFQFVGVMVWLPLMLLGADLAIRSPSWLGRSLWWGISGLALSQALAAWFGQGSYYAMLALGGYMAYRTLLFPPDDAVGRNLRARASGLVLHGGGVFAFGFALAAFGVLPRLEYNALSNLAGGYPAKVGAQSGWSAEDWALLLEPGVWYAGLIVVALALVAPLLARGRFAVPYFFALSLFTLVLSGQGPTPLHWALYLLPRFERLHPYGPDRIMLLFYLGAALLAGAALTGLKERAGEKRLLLALPVLAALLLGAMITLFPPKDGGWVNLYPLPLENGTSIPAGSLLFLLAAVALVVAYALLPTRLPALRNLAFTLLIFVVFADLMTANRATIAEQDLAGEGWAVKISETDPAAYSRPSGAARFLQSKEEEEGPFRYLGYDPGLGKTSHVSSPLRFADPAAQALEAGGRAMLMGLQDIQGYNPTHVARYDEYMNVLNGTEQNYHFIDVYEKGLSSPLLDLLNARYMIVPTQPSGEDPAGVQRFEWFGRNYPVAYEDDQSKVLENEDALPRAWIVHSTRQVGSGQEALELLNSDQVDPKETALLEDTPPEVSQPEDASADQTSVTEYGANRIQLNTSTQTAGLLILSEVYYPAWKAYVDGQPTPVQVADGLLRSVPIPAGEHTVELRYESWALRAGITISLVAYAALILLAVALGTRRLRSKGAECKEPATNVSESWL